MSSRIRIFLCVLFGVVSVAVLTRMAVGIEKSPIKPSETVSTFPTSKPSFEQASELMPKGARSPVIIDEFAFRTLGTQSGKQVLLRFRIKTGETWVREGMQWAKVNDDAPINAGNFDIAVEPTGDTYFAVRSNATDGKAWLLTYDTEWKWLLITEAQ